jgi:hypothetical protein
MQSATAVVGRILHFSIAVPCSPDCAASGGSKTRTCCRVGLAIQSDGWTVGVTATVDTVVAGATKVGGVA